MINCHPKSTLIDANKKLGDITHDSKVDVQMYQKLVERLIYLWHTRSGITFVISMVSQFMHKPFEEHLEAVYHIFKYLKSLLGRCLFFRKGDNQYMKTYINVD